MLLMPTEAPDLTYHFSLRLTMLDMFDGEGAKRAPGDLYLGREFLWVALSG